MRRRVLEISFVLVVVALTLFFVNARATLENAPEKSSSVAVQATASPSPDIDSQILDDYENAVGWTDCSIPDYSEFQEVPPLTSEMSARGRELFQANCAMCHGEGARGDGATGGSLSPLPTDLTNPAAYKYGFRPENIANITFLGIEGTAMAPWGDILDPADIWAIAAYIEIDILKKNRVSRLQRRANTGFRVKRITASVLADNVSDDDKAAIAGFVTRTVHPDPKPSASPSASPTPHEGRQAP